MKKIVCTIIIIVLLCYSAYQLLIPIVSKEEAITKAKEYVQIVNDKENLNYNINKPVEISTLDNSFFKRLTGNQTWNVYVDGIDVEVGAKKGELKKMTFPMDGIISKEDHPDWFQ